MIMMMVVVVEEDSWVWLKMMDWLHIMAIFWTEMIGKMMIYQWWLMDKLGIHQRFFQGNWAIWCDNTLSDSGNPLSTPTSTTGWQMVLCNARLEGSLVQLLGSSSQGSEVWRPPTGVVQTNVWLQNITIPIPYILVDLVDPRKPAFVLDLFIFGIRRGVIE